MVVLSNGAALPPSTRAYLAGLDPNATKMYGIGGKAVTAVHATFPSWQNWVTFTPLFGADRYGTAAAVARRFSYLPTSVVVASGANWPDALSGGAMAAHRGVPLLLTDPKVLPGPTGYYLGAKNNPITTATLVGGTAAISPAAATALGNSFSYPGQWDLVTILTAAERQADGSADGERNRAGRVENDAARSTLGGRQLLKPLTKEHVR